MEAAELSLLTSNAALSRFERAAERVLERKFDATLERLRAEDERPGFGWVDNDTAMRLLNLSRPTLARYRADGTLPYAKLGSSVYYRVSDIEAVLEARAVTRGSS